MGSQFASRDTNYTNDELHDDHSRAANDEDFAATEALNGPEREWGRACVDEGGDQGDEEGVLDRAEGGEEDGSEVEDEIDTGELLHHLHEDTCGGRRALSAYDHGKRLLVMMDGWDDLPTVVLRALVLRLKTDPWKQFAQLPIQLV